MAIYVDFARLSLYVVLYYMPNVTFSTGYDVKFFAITQVWFTINSIYVIFVIISRYYVNQFSTFERQSFSPLAS